MSAIQYPVSRRALSLRTMPMKMRVLEQNLREEDAAYEMGISEQTFSGARGSTVNWASRGSSGCGSLSKRIAVCMRIVKIAETRARYKYRRIHVLLRLLELQAAVDLLPQVAFDHVSSRRQRRQEAYPLMIHLLTPFRLGGKISMIARG